MTEQIKQVKIDVHQHLISDVFRKLLNSVGITGGAGEELAPWDENAVLAVMDRFNIRTSILSYTLSGIEINDAAFFRKLCRASNEYLAELCGKHPGRFGGFALLPLPDVAGTLQEIEYALDTLRLDGVGMHSNMGGIYPGDERFDPVFEELNRRKAVIHLHPTDIPEKHDKRPEWPPYIIEFMFETCRTAANLIYSGTMERFPDVSIILSHAGGAVPYLAWRLMTGEFTISNLKDIAPAGVFEYLRRFYYDTAMAASPRTFGSLMELVDPSRVLFGTDYPYMPDLAIEVYLNDITTYVGFDSVDRLNIFHGNALHLFPRFNEQGREKT